MSHENFWAHHVSWLLYALYVQIHYLIPTTACWEIVSSQRLDEHGYLKEFVMKGCVTKKVPKSFESKQLKLAWIRSWNSQFISMLWRLRVLVVFQEENKAGQKMRLEKSLWMQIVSATIAQWIKNLETKIKKSNHTKIPQF